MVIKGLVWKEEHQRWPARNGKPGGEAYDLVLLDETTPAVFAMSKPLRYRLSDEEKIKYWGKIERQSVNIAITEIMVRDGMPIVRGELVPDAPKQK